ncbi:MAG TPA: family 16 glycoside hydrolase [Planctomycetota bacterium]|nr:family 16 glycoside hydrolase [Planctomycetota bacterium]
MLHAIQPLALLLTAFAPTVFAQEPRAIFDGKSLDGFVGESDFWTVENGELVGRSTPQHPLSHSTWLIWRAGEVANFKLELDFKLIGGNSGVQFRSRDLGGFQVGGYQADLEDGPNWSGCLYEQEGRGVCARRGQSVRFEADGTSKVTKVADEVKLLESLRPREWNHYTIVARGPAITISLNGILMSSVEDFDPQYFAAKGILAFQLHQGPPMEVRYKKIELTEYPASPASPAAVAPPVDDAGKPKWIWPRADSSKDKEAFFEKRFVLTAAAKSAKFSGCADNQFEVFVNAAPVIDHEQWEQPVWVDVAKQLHAGDNVITIHAHNDGGPGAVQCALEIELADGTRQKIVSDTSWLAAGPVGDASKSGAVEHSAWNNAVSVGALGVRPWGNLPQAVPYVPFQALAAEELKVPEGFKAELIYTVPRRSQGSWVSMCFDDRGRIIACDQYGPPYRVTLEKGALKTVEQLDVPLGKAQGLCYAFDALYIVVSLEGEGYEPGLWRAKHRATDDRFEAPELLRKFDGNGEHGPHAVVLSPDGKSLFVVGGNHTKPPEPLTRSFVPQNWGEDQLLPQHADPNGHAVGITAPGGWICRTDRDGKEWELFACGFRNTYDMAFDAEGEAFTFDSDMEWDMGLPWYRPTMIQHVVPGGDYGWRTGSWRWPEYYPDSLPGVVDIGASSPTGMCFVPRSSPFATPGGGRLLVGDWAYGKIISVALNKSGASYTGSFETLVEGKPLPVTDMEFGPDGALYFLVGGRRTQSALYRVSGKSLLAKPEKPTGGDFPDAFGRCVLARELGYPSDPPEVSGGFSNDPLGYPFNALGSKDRFLRYTARAVIEKSPKKSWTQKALEETRPWSSIEALIAIARTSAVPLEVALSRFDALPLETMDEEHTLASLRALELIFIRMGKPEPARLGKIIARLDVLYPGKSNFANRELCQLLVYLESPNVVAKTLALIDSAKTPADQIAFAWSLRNLKTHWTLEERARFFRWMNETAAGWSGGLSFTKYLDDLRDDATMNLNDEERRLLADIVDKPRAVEASADATPRTLVRHWTVEDLLPAAPSARHDRDFDQGRKIYREARCYDCHRIAGEGGGSGPDLTGAGNRFGDRDLLEALIEPSKTISDQYQDTEVITKSDELFAGRLERRPNGDVRVWQIDSKHPIEVAAADIVTIRPYKLSRMPSGVLDSFEEQELIDLIAYLRSGANPDDAAFVEKH